MKVRNQRLSRGQARRITGHGESYPENAYVGGSELRRVSNQGSHTPCQYLFERAQQCAGDRRIKSRLWQSLNEIALAARNDRLAQRASRPAQGAGGPERNPCAIPLLYSTERFYTRSR
jgi:hypothetical protein